MVQSEQFQRQGIDCPGVERSENDLLVDVAIHPGTAIAGSEVDEKQDVGPGKASDDGVHERLACLVKPVQILEQDHGGGVTADGGGNTLKLGQQLAMLDCRARRISRLSNAEQVDEVRRVGDHAEALQPQLIFARAISAKSRAAMAKNERINSRIGRSGVTCPWAVARASMVDKPLRRHAMMNSKNNLLLPAPGSPTTPRTVDAPLRAFASA